MSDSKRHENKSHYIDLIRDARENLRTIEEIVRRPGPLSALSEPELEALHRCATEAAGAVLRSSALLSTLALERAVQEGDPK